MSQYIEGRISKATGYGTLGHLLEVLIVDREIHGGSYIDAEMAIQYTIDHADELWDSIVGPMLDRLEAAVTARV